MSDDKKPITGHLIGPFSMPVEYEVPEFRGFLGVPRPSVHADGWGEPYNVPGGAPGTKGGPNQAALLRKTKGTWKLKRYKKVQKVGDISWRGPLKDADKPKKGRYIISFHGPKSRHFASDAFSYGTSQNHRNVYMEGGLIGIAPGPVLGASLKLISDKKYLTVICMNEGKEQVLRREIDAPVYSNDPKDLDKLAKFADDTYKVGWRSLGVVTIDGDTYRQPQTPWFFNESGTEAQCIRQKEKDGTFNGATRKELAGDRFKVSVGEGVSTTPLGNLPPYEFKESGEMLFLGEWQSPPHNGYVHYWDEIRLEVKATCSGEQIVAVDYDGDTEVLVKAVIDVNHEIYRDYMKGTDTSKHRPGYTPDPAYENDNSVSLDAWYKNPLKIGIDPDKTYGNHEGRLWWGGHGTFVYLSFTLKGVEYRVVLESSGIMTETDYNELPPNPQDKEAFFRYYEVQYLRHLDVRAEGFVATRLEKFHEMLKQETTSKTVEETVDIDLTDREVTVYLAGEEKQEKGKATHHKRVDWNMRTVEQGGEGVCPHYTWHLVSQGLVAANPSLSGSVKLFSWWTYEPWSFTMAGGYLGETSPYVMPVVEPDDIYKKYVGPGWWDDWNTNSGPGVYNHPWHQYANNDAYDMFLPNSPLSYPQPWHPGPWEWTAQTYIGARPDDNDNCEIGNLPIHFFWPYESELHKKGWYGLKLLAHDKHTDLASFCQREDKTFILGGELPHPDTDVLTPVLYSEPLSIASAVDDAVYYPIGEL